MPIDAFYRRRHVRFALAWGVCCLLMLAMLAVLLPRSRVNTSVLALLPPHVQALQKASDEMLQPLEDVFMRRLERQIVWLVSPGAQDGMAPVEWWYGQIQQLGVLQQVHGPMSAAQQQEWGQYAFEHRNALLDSQTRERLRSGTQGAWILAQAYSPFAGVGAKELANDPLLLLRGAQLALLSQQGSSARLTLYEGWLAVTQADGRRWFWLYGELDNSSYDLKRSQVVVEQLRSLEQQLHARWPDAQVLSRGTLFYSDYASQQAQKDISRLGSVTVIGVFLLIYLAFHSLRPLLLCVLSVGSGILAGMVATLVIFGEIHLMTLVLNISVIGVSTDYAVYYLTERMVHGREMNPLQSTEKISSAQWLSMITTVLAYLIMVFAPFPGLQQLAVFASAGLCAAGLTVIYGFPYMVKGLPVRRVPAKMLLLRWLYAWRSKHWLRCGMPLALFIFMLYGISQLRVDDDIAQLQALPQAVLQQERKITTLTGQGMDQKWFIVYGESAEAALQNLEALQPLLAQARQDGLITHYRLFPLPSLRQQEQDLVLLRARAPVVIQQLGQAGLSVTAPDLHTMPVLAHDWLASSVSQGWRLLWASLPDGRSAVLVPVAGVQSAQASAALTQMSQGLDHVLWVDQKASYDMLFQHYRSMLGWLLLGAVGVMGAIYIWQFGVRKGLLSVVPSLLSLSTGLAVLAVMGQALNLFALLALVLVLGIGINYTLFFSNPRGTPTTSMFATALSFATTQLTLGMLIFSQTQAISSFGLVLSSGIFTAFLLSPLALVSKHKTHHTDR